MGHNHHQSRDLYPSEKNYLWVSKTVPYIESKLEMSNLTLESRVTCCLLKKKCIFYVILN